MERYRKKDMLQTVDTLLRANDVIIKTVRSNSQGVAEALVQCQESAIALGTYIDTLDEKYTSLVHVLEDYCENIYQMSENLSDENLCRKVSKKIQKQLTGLQNSIKYDLPEDRKEVVFLPYKASMWDSLESVWKAADADENTDAYVIPIPYFDKNPDGTFREEHCEGDQYPAYVPVTRYDEYDLKTRRPDVIYIHNPYDECNHVTSVHPYFYSKNLRNFTDRLVYIPYFILGEIEPDNQAAIDGMKHFCFLPGTIYAHQVIVQSENMRQIYINEYIKAAKEMGLPGEHVDRKFLEKKFLGTGSPKIDKVLNTRKEDLEIPAEWLKIIEKPDGSWKKIVFYNTSVSALLQHGEKMLRKMESVFEIFKVNRDEVALLWRPHPLIQATIESMRPRMWEGYQEIRDRYVEEGWGIYDDSADLDRAVVLSDAYYGDGSSVVGLCREKGMPVMVQDVEYHQSEITFFPCSIDGTWQEDNEVWFVGNEDNMLWRMNIVTNKIQYIAALPTKNIDGAFRMNTRCIKEGNHIFCLPDRSDRIVIYDIITKKAESCMIDIGENRTHMIDIGESRIGIYNAWKCENKIWCVSYFLQSILEIDIDNKCVDGIYPVFEEEKTLIGYEAAMQQGCIYCVSRNTKKISKFNIMSKSVKYYSLQINDEGFNTIAADENAFYLTGYKKAVYVWNEEKNSVVPIETFPSQYNVLNEEGLEVNCYEKPIFYRSVAMKSYILFLPWNFPEASSNGIIAYRKFDQRLILIDGGDERGSLFSLCYKKSGDVAGVYYSSGNCILEVDKNCCSKCVKQFDIPEYWSAMKRRNAMTEGVMYDLQILLNTVGEDLPNDR